MLNDLSRYTHRTAIGNERIKAITAQDEVIFSVRADAHGGRRRVRLDGQEFIRRPASPPSRPHKPSWRG